MKIVLFWSSILDQSYNSHNDWRNSTIKLSSFHYLSLLSHIKFNNEVELYTYQNTDNTNIPSEIILKDANDIFPSEYAYNALIRGHSIAHISDAVRLIRASEINGVVIDLDAVVLNKFPDNVNNGWFASMPAKATGGFAPKWGNSHPPLTIHDNSWDGKALAMFPIKINDITKKYTQNSANKILKTLALPPAKESSHAWNYVMWTLKDIMKVNKNLTVYPPITFCPISGWLSSGKCYSLESPTRLDGKTELFGHTLPSIATIIQETITVQHFFESAFQKASQVKSDFWLNVKEGSLVSIEAEHILGNNWREILNNYANKSEISNIHNI